jgi:hypothetical protein
MLAPERAAPDTGLRLGSSTCSRMPLNCSLIHRLSPVHAQGQSPFPARQDFRGAGRPGRQIDVRATCAVE